MKRISEMISLPNDGVTGQHVWYRLCEGYHSCPNEGSHRYVVWAHWGYVFQKVDNFNISNVSPTKQYNHMVDQKEGTSPDVELYKRTQRTWVHVCGQEGGGVYGMFICSRKKRRKPTDSGGNLMDSQEDDPVISSPYPHKFGLSFYCHVVPLCEGKFEKQKQWRLSTVY